MLEKLLGYEFARTLGYKFTKSDAFVYYYIVDVATRLEQSSTITLQDLLHIQFMYLYLNNTSML